MPGWTGWLAKFVFTTNQVKKIDHHRGPVAQVKVAQNEVLVSASRDGTVCLWSLENFTLLNLIQMHSPVVDIQISIDSVGMPSAH